MAQLNRGDFNTAIINETADFLNKIQVYIRDNNNREITAQDARVVLEDCNQALDALFVITKDSHFNIISDTTNQITEGNDPDKNFCSDVNFLKRLEDPAVCTTDNLNEGTQNLYYTNARVDARINSLRPVAGIVANLGITAAANYNQSQIQQIVDKVNQMLAAMRTSNTIAS